MAENIEFYMKELGGYWNSSHRIGIPFKVFTRYDSLDIEILPSGCYDVYFMKFVFGWGYIPTDSGHEIVGERRKNITEDELLEILEYVYKRRKKK